MVEITDWKSAEAWLRTQPREVQVVFVARCALRAFPAIAIIQGEIFGGVAIATLRALLTSGVAAVGPTPEVRRAATAAADAAAAHRPGEAALAADAAAARAALSTSDFGPRDAVFMIKGQLSDDAYSTAAAAAAAAATAAAFAVADDDAPGRVVANAAGAVGDTARTVASAGGYDPDRDLDAAAADARTATTSDVIWLERNGDRLSRLFEEPLWHDKSSHKLGSLIGRIWFGRSVPPQTWQFWREWYDGMLAGRPMDWALQEAVALIPDEIWEAGPEAVAEEIERVEAELLARKLPLAEEIRVNPETGRFRAEPVEPANPALLATSLARVSDAVDDVLESPSNGLRDDAYEVKTLRRVLARYGNDPQRIETDFTDIHGWLVRKMTAEVAELPASDENIALTERLEQAARWIRANHPEIDANRRDLMAQAAREMSGSDREELEQAVPALEAISEGPMAEDWPEDIPAITRYEGRPSPYTHSPDEWHRVLDKGPFTRVFGRLPRMLLELKRNPDLVDVVYNSNAHKLVLLGISAKGLMEFLSALVRIGRGLFF